MPEERTLNHDSAETPTPHVPLHTPLPESTATGEPSRKGKVAVVGVLLLASAGGGALWYVTSPGTARVESRDRREKSGEDPSVADRAIADAVREAQSSGVKPVVPQAPPALPSAVSGEGLSAVDATIDGAVEPVATVAPPASAATAPAEGESSPREPAPRPNGERSIWYRTADTGRPAQPARSGPAAPDGPVKPSFGSVLPVRTLGATVTLRQGGLARLELTRDVEGRGWSMRRGTVIVAVTRGSEYDRAYYEAIGFIDPQSGRMVRVGGDVLGTDGASGIRGKRRHMTSAWARVFGSLARTAKGMAEGAARAWVQGRVSGGQTIVIPDVTPGIPLASQFAGASSDRTFVEVKAGTLAYVLISELPTEIRGVEAVGALEPDEIAEYADIAKANPATGLADEELSSIVATGSPEEIRAAMPRMTADMRRLAESVLVGGR